MIRHSIISEIFYSKRIANIARCPQSPKKTLENPIQSGNKPVQAAEIPVFAGIVDRKGFLISFDRVNNVLKFMGYQNLSSKLGKFVVHLQTINFFPGHSSQ